MKLFYFIFKKLILKKVNLIFKIYGGMNRSRSKNTESIPTGSNRLKIFKWLYVMSRFYCFFFLFFNLGETLHGWPHFTNSLKIKCKFVRDIVIKFLAIRKLSLRVFLKKSRVFSFFFFFNTLPKPQIQKLSI